jgi:hypothetical protein
VGKSSAIFDTPRKPNLLLNGKCLSKSSRLSYSAFSGAYSITEGFYRQVAICGACNTTGNATVLHKLGEVAVLALYDTLQQSGGGLGHVRLSKLALGANASCKSE